MLPPVVLLVALHQFLPSVSLHAPPVAISTERHFRVVDKANCSTGCVMMVCRSAPRGSARWYIGDNATLFSRYLDALGVSGEIEGAFCDASELSELADSLWKTGELVVHDREAWRKMVVTASSAPSQLLRDSAQRALRMWQGMEQDVEAARTFLIQQGLMDKPLQTILDVFKQNYPYYRDACEACGGSSTFFGEVLCVSEADLASRARKAELRVCESCGKLVRFVRSNDVGLILRAKKGRCGEYSTVMLAVVLALGHEARLVFDTTDHVWIELMIGDRWVPADPCEAALDQPGLYESWGKNGSLVVAYERNRAEDVTLKYYTNRQNVDAIRREDNVSEADVQLVLRHYEQGNVLANSTRL